MLTLPSSTASVPAAPSAATAALVAPELEQPLVVVDHLGNLVRQLKGERLQPRGLRPMHHLKQRGVPLYTIHATACSCYLKSENEIRSLRQLWSKTSFYCLFNFKTRLFTRDCTVSLTGETSVTGEISKFHR